MKVQKQKSICEISNWQLLLREYTAVMVVWMSGKVSEQLEPPGPRERSQAGR